MNIEKHPSHSRWSRHKEAMVTTLVTTLLAWVPLPPGRIIRRLMYRTIFEQIGTSAQIDPSVKFVGAENIRIGNGAKIDADVYLKSLRQNSKIWIGDRTRLNHGVDIKALGSGRIEIGENTYIGPYACLAGESISVGKDCMIASHVGIYATNHIFTDPTRRLREQGVSFKGIVIEEDCWLGSGVKVVDGVTINQGSVIGAGAVVTKDIPPYSVAVGVPARVIASRKSSEQVSTEQVSTQSQEYIHKDGSHLPIPLNAAFAEIEETTELIQAEVEETDELLQQRFQAVKDNVPAHFFLQNLLHHLLDCIRQVMVVDTVAVLLQTEDGQQLAVHATLGLEEEIAEKIQIPIGRGFAGRIAANCELMIVDDLSTVEVVSPILRNKGIRSMLGVPLMVKDRMIGVFHVGTFRPRQFSRDDAQLLEFVADHVGLAVDRLNSKPSIAKGSALVWQKFALTCLQQKVSRTIRNFTFDSHPTRFLELTPPFLRLASIYC